MNQSAVKAARKNMKATGIKSRPDGTYKVPRAAKKFYASLPAKERGKLRASWRVS